MADSKFFFIDISKQSAERYDLSRFLEWVGDNYDPLTSNFLYEVTNIPEGGRYTVQGEDGRPDLLSYSIYNDVQYWWILMTYNNFTSVGDIVNGLEIKFPSLQALEDFYFTLKINQNKADA